MVYVDEARTLTQRRYALGKLEKTLYDYPAFSDYATERVSLVALLTDFKMDALALSAAQSRSARNRKAGQCSSRHLRRCLST